jgi:hypothetical protein
MEKCNPVPRGEPAHRLLRERSGASPFETALFAGAVLLASIFAYSATAGSVSRALWRIAIVLGWER